MNPIAFVALVFFVVGIVITVAGYLIRVKNQVWMIAGYDPNRVKDKEGLARLVGTGLLIIGDLDILVSVLIAILPRIMPAQVIAYLVINIGGMIVLIIKAQKYAA